MNHRYSAFTQILPDFTGILPGFLNGKILTAPITITGYPDFTRKIFQVARTFSLRPEFTQILPCFYFYKNPGGYPGSAGSLYFSYILKCFLAYFLNIFRSSYAICQSNPQHKHSQHILHNKIWKLSYD